MNKTFNSKKLVYNYTDMLYRIAMGYLRNNEDSEDIVQETFFQYLKYVKSGKNFKDEEHEKCWLIRVTINLSCNKLKYGRQIQNIPFDDESVQQIPLYNQDMYLLEDINKLKDKYKSVFELFYLKDLKVSQISRILNISEAAVKTRLKRAREYLKEILQNDD